MNNQATKRGFTLIELSIVIVIIGLIVAGVVAGQTLVKQAKLRNIITDKDAFTVALNTFEMQYNGFAGDLDNATSYWSSQTKNGNGDKVISLLQNSGGSGATEVGLVFQHLSLAGLISGTFTSANSLQSTPEMAYKGPFTDTVYLVTGYTPTPNGQYDVINRNHLGGNTTNVIRLGKYTRYSSSNNTLVGYGAVTIDEAVNIDKKIDDGLARSGAFTGHNEEASGSRTTVGCLEFGGGSTSNSSGAANYNIGADFVCNISFDYR